MFFVVVEEGNMNFTQLSDTLFHRSLWETCLYILTLKLSYGVLSMTNLNIISAFTRVL